MGYLRDREDEDEIEEQFDEADLVVMVRDTRAQQAAPSLSLRHAVPFVCRQPIVPRATTLPRPTH